MDNIMVLNILRETKRKRKPIKIKTQKRIGKGIKIKRFLKIKLPSLKKRLKPTILQPIPAKKGKSNIKPLSLNPDGLAKLLKEPVPATVKLIQLMSTLLIMYYNPQTKDKIEKKYEEVLEKLIEIYSTLEMKPFRVKILNDAKKVLEESKKPKSLSKSLSKSKKLNKSLKKIKTNINKSKKLRGLIEQYVNKNIKKSKRMTEKSKIHPIQKPMFGGRVVKLTDDWFERNHLPAETTNDCVSNSIYLLNSAKNLC